MHSGAQIRFMWFLGHRRPGSGAALGSWFEARQQATKLAQAYTRRPAKARLLLKKNQAKSVKNLRAKPTKTRSISLQKISKPSCNS